MFLFCFLPFLPAYLQDQPAGARPGGGVGPHCPLFIFILLLLRELWNFVISIFLRRTLIIMQPTAHYTDDERRRMANYHARPPADGDTHPRPPSTVLSSATSSSSSSAVPSSTENANPRSGPAKGVHPSSSSDASSWVSPEEVSARAEALGATSSSHSSSSLLLHNPSPEVSLCFGRRSTRSRQAPGPGYLADYVSTPPQENRKKRRLIIAPPRRVRSDLPQQPEQTAAGGGLAEQPHLPPRFQHQRHLPAGNVQNSFWPRGSAPQIRTSIPTSTLAHSTCNNYRWCCIEKWRGCCYKAKLVTHLPTMTASPLPTTTCLTTMCAWVRIVGLRRLVRTQATTICFLAGSETSSVSSR